MKTEIDIARDMGVEIVGARPKAGTAAAAMDMLREHAEMMRMAYDLATAMVGTSMVPKIYQRKGKEDQDAANNATAAILYGLEIGLNPIQSLQQVFSVHGTPAIYAKTMVALLKSKGYKFKTIESSAERVTYSGWWPGEEPETSTWDMDRAIKAGFVPTVDEKTGEFKKNQYGKLIGNEKYLTQPEEMLWAKAASTVCRRLAPDVLLGIGRTVEDMESEPEPDPVRVQSERVRVAEMLDQGAEAEAPKVQQWQAAAEDAPEAPSNSGEKPEAAQVEPPTEETPAEQEPPKKAPAKRASRRTKPGMITADQLDQAAAKLNALGLTEQEEKRRCLDRLFGRPVADPRDLTEADGEWLLEQLDDAAKAAAETGEQLAADVQGGAQ